MSWEEERSLSLSAKLRCVWERDSWVRTGTLCWSQCGCFPLLLDQGWLQTAVFLLCRKREVHPGLLGRCKVSPAQSNLVLLRTFLKIFNSSQHWDCQKSSFTVLKKTFFVQRALGYYLGFNHCCIFFGERKIYKALLSASIIHFSVLLFF